MEKSDFNVPSTDGLHTLKGIVYEPDSRPLGVFHIVHGMSEHIGRYDEFMTELCENGWLVCGYDNLGHRYTAKDDSELGYIAPKDGWKYLVRDVQAFREKVAAAYGVSYPYVLMGHSMGSFIARLAAVVNPRPDKLIIMGTGGPNPAAGPGKLLAGTIAAVKGDKHVSPFLEGIIFKGYNDRFKNDPDSDEFSWLSTLKNTRIKYIADKYAGFHFTSSGLKDLITLTKKTGDKKWFSAVNKTLPILLVSGSEDPVGNYGKGVEQVYKLLKAQKLKPEPQFKLYEGARHEILNDFCRDEVVRDILAFIN